MPDRALEKVIMMTGTCPHVTGKGLNIAVYSNGEIKNIFQNS
jgi:hypothetical protein